MSFDTPSRNSSLAFLSDAWNALTLPSRQVTDLYERRQAQLTSTIALISLILSAVGAIFAPLQSLRDVLGAFGPLMTLLVAAYLLARTRFYRLAAFLIVLGLFTSGYSAIIFTGSDIATTLLVYISLGLAVSSALLSDWAIFLLMGINAGFVLFGLPAFGVALPDNLGGALGPLTNLGFLFITLNYFRRQIEQERVRDLERTNQELYAIRQALEQRVEERTQELNRRSAQLEASTLIARSAAMVHNLNELLENVVQQITERFGYYHTAIFLTDPAEKFLILQAASSEGGKNMIQRGFKTEIGRQGMVGYAAYQRRPRIAQDVSTDPTYLHVPELPETRSEAALPLIARNRVLGVLDIQSEEPNAFTFDDIYTLQNMADQIALAMDNAILIQESNAALQELQARNALSTANAWQLRLGEGRQGFIYTPLGVTPLQEYNPMQNGQTDEKTLVVPVNLRGKVIGSLWLKRKASERPWNDAEREMAERIAGQVAFALDNARVLEESQRRAAREQTVSAFSERFSRSLDIDSLLQNAVRELHTLPQVAEVSVFIHPERASQSQK